MRAVEKFDYKLHNKFSTYAVEWIRQGIRKALRENRRRAGASAKLIETIGKVRRRAEELYQESGKEPSLWEVAKAARLTVDTVGNTLYPARIQFSMDREVGDGTHKVPFGSLIEDENTPRPDYNLSRCEEIEKVREVIETLPPQQREVMKLYYGIGDREPHSLEQVGEILHLSRERVRQVKRVAEQKFRCFPKRGVLEPLYM